MLSPHASGMQALAAVVLQNVQGRFMLGSHKSTTPYMAFTTMTSSWQPCLTGTSGAGACAF